MRLVGDSKSQRGSGESGVRNEGNFKEVRDFKGHSGTEKTMTF